MADRVYDTAAHLVPEDARSVSIVVDGHEYVLPARMAGQAGELVEIVHEFLETAEQGRIPTLSLEHRARLILKAVGD